MCRTLREVSLLNTRRCCSVREVCLLNTRMCCSVREVCLLNTRTCCSIREVCLLNTRTCCTLLEVSPVKTKFSGILRRSCSQVKTRKCCSCCTLFTYMFQFSIIQLIQDTCSGKPICGRICRLLLFFDCITGCHVTGFVFCH